MKTLHLAAAALLAALSLPSLAQPASAPGMGPCPATAASAADGACGQRPKGAHHRMRKGPGADDTPGWSMMSREERRDHHDKIRSMKDYDECKAYLDKHRDDMAARARKLGHPMPPEPRRDACLPLKRAKP
jgi:hypothetical protein